MSRLWNVTTIAAFVVTAATLSGCSESRPPQEPAAQSTSEEPAASTDVDADNAEIGNELAKLSPEDRQLVLAQKICPVSEQPLGSMGRPLKVTVDGKTLFICCEGCRDDAEENFAEHLARFESQKS